MEQVITLYKYQKQNADELSFEKGCVINVINKLDSDWWTGELNGQTGLFPSNYVAPLSSVAESDQSSAIVTCELICSALVILLFQKISKNSCSCSSNQSEAVYLLSIRVSFFNSSRLVILHRNLHIAPRMFITIDCGHFPRHIASDNYPTLENFP